MLSRTTTALILSLSFMITNTVLCAQQTTEFESFTFNKAAKHTSADDVIRATSTFKTSFKPCGVVNNNFVIKRQTKFNFKTRRDELRTIKSIIVCTATQSSDLQKKLSKPGPTYIKVTGGERWDYKEELWFEIPPLDFSSPSESSFSSDSSD